MPSQYVVWFLQDSFNSEHTFVISILKQNPTLHVNVPCAAILGDKSSLTS